RRVLFRSRFAQGSVADHYVEMCTATGDRDLWVMGGGDLAGQYADEGFLDEIITYTAPVVLGKGRPLLPRRLDLELIEVGHSDPFVNVRHRVLGPHLKIAERVSPGPSPRRGGPTILTQHRSSSARSVTRMPGSCGTGRRFRDSMQA